jgi:FlaA1/EpsC-like NDP-sugar epimerase/lipopolysaccharide/colanic/teichoic acid biosynthesis glycosyltransferase
MARGALSRSDGMKPWQGVIKRAMDLGLAIIAFAALSPLFILIAIAVVADSAGPAIYGARRVGRGGREFTMFKFRSMARGADALGPGVTSKYDYRVTRVGGFLRRTKLDELPQLLNVIAGHMSLVGPRPESPRYVELWSADERAVLTLRPGVTGPAQIAYIDEEEQLSTPDPDAAYESDLLHAKLKIDLEYVRHYTVRRDIALLWQTVAGIFSAAERRSNQPRRRYTLAERLGSGRLWQLALDGALAAVAAGLAVGLRIDRNNIFAAIATYWVFVPMAAVIRPLGFLVAGAYLRVWRYPTVSDVALVFSSLVAGSVVMALGIFLVLQPSAVPGSVGFPRSALAIEFVLSAVVLGGVRIASRIRQEGLDVAPVWSAGPPRPVLIYGAGEAGAQLAREMLRNRALRMEPVGFLDDDVRKRSRRIYGVEVLGGAEDLPRIVREREIAEVIIAMPRIAGSALRGVIALCEAAAVPVRTLPGVEELLDSSAAVSKIRPIRLDDLLRRDPAEIPEQPIRQFLAERTMLVTGAGGSIGSEVCRQAAALGVSELVLVERAETALFWIDDELRRRHPLVRVTPRLGDVTDAQFIDQVMTSAAPHIVVHAAANKHVPLSESNVAATVLTNVRGTRVVAEAASRHRTPAFIFVSTDKAVDPTSVMGATKRIGELLVSEIGADSLGRHVTVRFGNVLGSQGSVIDLWSRQILDGGPITVTDPAMRRYFMTIPEASRLILLAGAIGQSGDIHVLRMGDPVLVTDLAQDLIRLVAPPGLGLEVVFTGLRPGERLEESLFASDEQPEPTPYEAIMVARAGRHAEGTIARACQLEELAGRAEIDDGQALRRELMDG